MARTHGLGLRIPDLAARGNGMVEYTFTYVRTHSRLWSGCGYSFEMDERVAYLAGHYKDEGNDRSLGSLF